MLCRESGQVRAHSDTRLVGEHKLTALQCVYMLFVHPAKVVIRNIVPLESRNDLSASRVEHGDVFIETAIAGRLSNVVDWFNPAFRCRSVRSRL